MRPWFSLLILSATLNASALEIGAGQKGIARRRVLLANELMNSAVYSCLVQSEDCKLTEADGVVLNKIFSLVNTPEGRSEVEFKSARENPGTFDVGSGSHRLAVTERKPGAKIFINSDLIDPQATGVSLESMISIFVHESGHHAGYPDTDEHVLDNLGNKVARLFAQTVQRLQSEDPLRASLEILVYNRVASPDRVYDWDKIGSWPEIIVSNGERIFSIGSSYPLLLNCPYGMEIHLAWLTDLHWTADGRVGGKDKHFCQASPSKFEVNENYYVDLEFPDPPQQMVGTSLIELMSHRSYDKLLGMRGADYLVDVISTKAQPASLEQGGVWNVVMELKGEPKNFRECALLITSEEFSLRYPTGQIQAIESDAKKCKMTALGKGRMRVEAQHQFEKDTVKRNYYLKAVKLEPKSIADSGIGAALPSTRLTVQVGKRANPPSSLSEIILTSDGASVKAKGFVKNGLCRKFNLSFDLPGNAELLQAHVKYTLNYRGGVLSPITLTDRLTLHYLHLWETESTLKPGGGRTNKFTLYFFPEFMQPEDIERIDIREITAMTADLEEHRIAFAPNEFGLNTWLRLGMPCE